MSFDHPKSALDLQQLMLETISLATHHDTITGTSKQAVINKEIRNYLGILKENLDWEINFIQEKLFYEFGILLNNIEVCQPRVNKRYHCPNQDSLIYNLTESAIITVYNPTVSSIKVVHFTFSHPKLSVSVWNVETVSFQEVESYEALCNKNFDFQYECDVYVEIEVPALSIRVFQISPNQTKDIKVS